MLKTPILYDYIDRIDKAMIDNIIKTIIPKRKILYESDEEIDEEIELKDEETDEEIELKDEEIDEENEIIFVDEYEYKEIVKTFEEKLEDENKEILTEINIEQEKILTDYKQEEKKEAVINPTSNIDYINHKDKIDLYNTNDQIKLFLKNTLKNVEQRLDKNGQLKTNLLMTKQFDLCKDLILYFQYSMIDKKDDLNKKLKHYKLNI